MMYQGSVMQGLALIFLGMGGSAAADVATVFGSPILGLGYLLGAVIFLIAGLVRVLKAF